MNTSSGTISTISELLALSAAQYRIYDIGRRVDKISKEQFAKIEAAQMPYPFPLQGHAMFAISFWQQRSNAPYLWFVKLPLDERGLLNQGARNHFIAIIIEALGQDLTVDPTEKQASLLEKNPYHFTPAQYKLAAVNSLVTLSVKHQPSQFYQPALDYLAGELGFDNWQNIGVQGLSDFSVRLTESNNAQILENSLSQLPEEVLLPLCSALENVKLPAGVIKQLTQRYQQAKQTQQHSIMTALLRALSASTQHPNSVLFLNKLLTDASLSIDTLIIFTGRLWPVFAEAKSLISYLEQLCKQEDDELFLAMFKDLVAIPQIRPILLQAIRSPNRSNSLTMAIDKIFTH